MASCSRNHSGNYTHATSPSMKIWTFGWICSENTQPGQTLSSSLCEVLQGITAQAGMELETKLSWLFSQGSNLWAMERKALFMSSKFKKKIKITFSVLSLQNNPSEISPAGCKKQFNRISPNPFTFLETPRNRNLKEKKGTPSSSDFHIHLVPLQWNCKSYSSSPKW